MRAEIIATGSELLTGGLVDTNSVFLSEELIPLGIETAFKTVVGDSEKDLEESFRRAMDRAEVMIIQLYRGGERFDGLGGLQSLKSFCLRAMRRQGHRDPL